MMTTLSIDDGDFQLSGQVVREQARAWPRYWSRMLDVLIWNILLALLLQYTFPDFASSKAFEGGGAGLFSMMLLPVGMVIDAAVLTGFGNTLGRALMGIRVETIWHERLDFAAALKRNLRVWVFGLALAFPLFSLITLSRNYSRVNEGDQTSWDDTCSTRVYDIDCNPARIWMAALLFVGLSIGIRVFEAHDRIAQSDAQIATPHDDTAPTEIPPPQVDAGDPIAAQLAQGAAQVKPKMLDKVTRIDRAEADGRTLTYYYSITHRDASNGVLRSFFNQTILPNLCSQADTKRMLKDYGITYRYLYTIPDASEPIEFRVTWADC